MVQLHNSSTKQNPSEKRITKSDILLILLLLLIGFAGLILVRVRMGADGTAVRVISDGVLYGTYDLSQTATVPIRTGGRVTNTLLIADGKASMMEADCPDKLCMHQNAISRQGETIVCLPNKVVVEVDNGQEADFDSISR